MHVDLTLSRVDGRYRIGKHTAFMYRLTVFANGFVVTFWDGQEFQQFDAARIDDLRRFVRDREKVLIGFDSFGRDDCLLRRIVESSGLVIQMLIDMDRLLCTELKRMSEGDRQTWFKAIKPKRIPWAFSVDLNKVTNTIVSLHEHGCRLGLPVVLEWPLSRNSTLGDAEKGDLWRHHQRDLGIMAVLYEQSREYIDIRAQLATSFGLGAEVFCQANAQLAETLMLSELRRLTGRSRSELLKLAKASENNCASSFPIADLIPSGITFSTPEFQEVFDVLAEGAVERDANGDLVLVTEMPGNTVVIGGCTLKFGCGGVHSQDEPGIFRADGDYDLIDVDAASYYPALMLAFSIYPAHALPIFLEVLRAVRDRRLEAKSTGDTLIDAALKIAVNSLFGKLGSPYSPLHDARACMQVTLTGQVLQLTMIEAMQLAGATPLSVNTDGILFQVPKALRTAFDQAIADWQEAHGLVLETKSYRAYARRDINNYLALTVEATKDGQESLKVKAKGIYNPSAPKASGRVIRLAVSNALLTGEPIEVFIARHERAADFLFHDRCDSLLQCFEQDGQRLPPTVRWYATSTGGRPIDLVHATNATRTQVERGQQARLALHLPEGYGIAELPDLDRSFYIAEAHALMDTALMGGEVDQGTAEARALQAQGITLLPRQGTKNPSGVELRDAEALMGLQDRRSADWGVVTGSDFDVMALDLDNLSRLDPQMLSLLKQYPTLTTWHGEGTADAVRDGSKRGAVYFWYSGGDARIRTRADQSFLQRHGFELAYGGKVQAAVGRHRTARDRYMQHGTIVEAPVELIDFLTMRLPLPGTRRPPKPDPTEDVTLPLLRQAADETFGANWSRYFHTSNGLNGVHGQTPGHATSLRLWLRRGRVCGFTFHATFPIRANAALVQQSFDRLCAAANIDADPDPEDRHLDPSQVPPPLTAEETITAQTCADAFARIQKHGAITAVMGAGKSLQAARECLDRHEQGQRTLVLVPDKEAMVQQRAYILKEAKERGIDTATLAIQTLSSTRGVTDDDDDDTDAADDEQGTRATRIRKGTLVVISHHHYGSRRKLTTKFYEVVHWAAKNGAEVIVDEADLYISRQNHDLQLDARYALFNGQHSDWTRRTHCPSATGSFGCGRCRWRSGGRVHNHVTHLAYKTPGVIPQSQFENRMPEEFVIPAESLPVKETKDLPRMNLRISTLVQTPNYLRQRSYEKSGGEEGEGEGEGEAGSPRQMMFTYMRDLIDCAYHPVLVEPVVIDQHGIIVREDPHALATTTAPGRTRIDGESTAGWGFPYFPCGVRYVLAYDMAAVFYLMKHAARTIWISATLGSEDLCFLRACADGVPVEHIDIPEPPYKPLEKVIVIGHHARIRWPDPLGERAAEAMGCNYNDVEVTNRTTIERLGNALSALGKRPLIFLGTKAEAKAAFSRMKEPGWTFFIEGEHRMHTARAVTETQTTDGSMSLLSYGRSSVGTGANKSDYHVVVVDATVKKPHFVFNPSMQTEAAFLAAQEADRVRVAFQNAGRILRGEGVKVIFTVGLSQSEVDRLCVMAGRLTPLPVETWFTTDETDLALVTLVASTKAGALTVPALPAPKAKTRSQRSHKQRAGVDAKEKKGGAKAAKIQRVIHRVEVLARSGVCWRTVQRKVSFNRFDPFEQLLLQGAYDCAVKEAGS